MHQARQAVQVGLRGAAWHGDAGLAEHMALAQVQIGDDQPRARRPIQGALPQ
ncbi:hypothetical protein D3C73_1569200 [compost metagenome]